MNPDEIRAEIQAAQDSAEQAVVALRDAKTQVETAKAAFESAVGGATNRLVQEARAGFERFLSQVDEVSGNAGQGGREFDEYVGNL